MQDQVLPVRDDWMLVPAAPYSHLISACGEREESERERERQSYRQGKRLFGAVLADPAGAITSASTTDDPIGLNQQRFHVCSG